jgi:hypothetical protein
MPAFREKTALGKSKDFRPSGCHLAVKQMSRYC